MIYRIFLLTFFGVLFLHVPASAQETSTQKVIGDWQGVLDAGAVKSRIVFHFKSEKDVLRGAMDIPDQRANGIPIDSVVFENSMLKFVMSKLGASYEGTLKGDEIIGNFSTSKHVGVLGTTGTIQSNSYKIEINKFFPDIQVHQQACPMWVPLIENNEYNSRGADYFVKEYINQLDQQNPRNQLYVQ